MAFKNLEAMYSELSNQNVINWRLLDTKGGMVSEFTADKPDLAIQRLKEVLDGQSDDLFALEYKNNIAPAAKYFRNTFRNRDDSHVASVQPQTAVIQGNTKEEVESAIEKALNEYKKEIEIAGIKEKNKELEQQLKDATPSQFEATIIKLGEVVLPLIENYTKKQASLGKINEQKKQQMAKSENRNQEVNSDLNLEEEKLANNLSAMVEKIAASGLDPIEVTEKLANLSEEKLNMALKFL
jgi:predicted RNase H-like HicB family nuclease